MSIETQAQENRAALAQSGPGLGTKIPEWAAFADRGKDTLLKIKVKVKEVYGLPKVYVQSFQAGPLSILTGQKTLTDSSIKALKALGYVFEGLEG